MLLHKTYLLRAGPSILELEFDMSIDDWLQEVLIRFS